MKTITCAVAALCVIGAIFGSSSAIMAADEAVNSGVLLYAGFEGTKGAADADVAAGDPVARLQDGALKFVPGKRGNAILVGDGLARVQYDALKNILPKQGSIEFFIRTENWEGDPGKVHAFIEAVGSEANILYYFRSANKINTSFWTGKRRVTAEGKYLFTNVDVSINFNPREWHHIILTWSPEDARFYINGQMCHHVAKPELPTDLETITIGDWSTDAPHGGHTLIDELYIYGRALSDKEAAWAYMNADKRECGKDVPAAK